MTPCDARFRGALQPPHMDIANKTVSCFKQAFGVLSTKVIPGGYKMPSLNIKDEDLYAKIKRLAELRGTTSVQAVRDAVDRELQAAQKDLRQGSKSLSERLQQLSRQTSALPTLQEDDRDAHPRLRSTWYTDLMVIDSSALIAILLGEPEDT